jgi:ABC-type multidrug transport system fused ATPase/permease subunit
VYDKEIILLGESTSSVASASEVQIYKNIFSQFSGKTFIVSIHKMNLLKYFDRIIIFEKGKISDQGSFAELYENNKIFAQQWDDYISSH